MKRCWAPLLLSASAIGRAVRVDLIVDTDMSIDVDDVGALCLAHALADLDEARILAVVHNSASPRGVGALSVINSWRGRSEIPVGAYGGTIGDPAGTSTHSPWGFSREPPAAPWQIGPYVEDLVEQFPSRVRSASEADGTAVQVLRRALAAAADKSVSIASVGYATNLHDLLASKADDASPLAGVALVEAKVKRLVMMGGRKDHVEWNFAGAESNGISVCGGATGGRNPCGPHNNLGRITNATLRRWPAATELVFVDFETGVEVWTGGVLASAEPAHSPCRRAYDVFCRINQGWCQGTSRCSWDIQAVLYAVRGAEGYYSLERGHVTVDPVSAMSEWKKAGPEERKPEFSLRLNAARKGELEREISALLARPMPLGPSPSPPPSPQSPSPSPSPPSPSPLPPPPPSPSPSPPPSPQLATFRGLVVLSALLLVGCVARYRSLAFRGWAGGALRPAKLRLDTQQEDAGVTSSTRPSCEDL